MDGINVQTDIYIITYGIHIIDRCTQRFMDKQMDAGTLYGVHTYTQQHSGDFLTGTYQYTIIPTNTEMFFNNLCFS